MSLWMKNTIYSILFVLTLYVLVCFATHFQQETRLPVFKVTGKCYNYDNHRDEFRTSFQKIIAGYPEIRMMGTGQDENVLIGKLSYEQKMLSTAYYFSLFIPSGKGKGFYARIGTTCPRIKARAAVTPSNFFLSPFVYSQRNAVHFKPETRKLFYRILTESHELAAKISNS